MGSTLTGGFKVGRDIGKFLGGGGCFERVIKHKVAVQRSALPTARPSRTPAPNAVCARKTPRAERSRGPANVGWRVLAAGWADFSRVGEKKRTRRGCSGRRGGKWPLIVCAAALRRVGGKVGESDRCREQKALQPELPTVGRRNNSEHAARVTLERPEPLGTGAA